MPVPVDDEGLDVDALAATGARAVLVTPAHQFPTGVTLSARRREALVRWAEAVGGWVIEDDYDGGLWYERTPGRSRSSASPPTGSSTPGPPARRWRPDSDWAGSRLPTRWWSRCCAHGPATTSAPRR